MKLLITQHDYMVQVETNYIFMWSLKSNEYCSSIIDLVHFFNFAFNFPSNILTWFLFDSLVCLAKMYQRMLANMINITYLVHANGIS